MQLLAQVLTTILAFAIFYALAKKLFWDEIQQTIDERQGLIKGDFDRIDALQREVASMREDYTQRLANIEAESRQRIQEAIAQGRKTAEEIADNARREAEAAAEKQRQALALEMEQARAILKEEVVRLTLAATEKIIRQRLDQPQQKQLVSSFVEELARR